jgi:hypothetical protein
MKKETLRIVDNELHENILLFAISSSASDIRICQVINHFLGIRLALTNNLEITRKKITVNFRRYAYESHEEIEKYTLIVNRNNGNVLFQELRKIDYILIITTESPKGPIEESLQKLRNSGEVSAIYKVDTVALKSLNNIQI